MTEDEDRSTGYIGVSPPCKGALVTNEMAIAITFSIKSKIYKNNVVA